MAEMNLKDIAHFTDVLLRVGFRSVLNPRMSKICKVSHPYFQKDYKGVCGTGEDSKKKIEKDGTEIQCKRKRQKTGERKHSCEDEIVSNAKNSELLTKSQVTEKPKMSAVADEDTVVETAAKKRRVNSTAKDDKTPKHGKGKTISNTHMSVANTGTLSPNTGIASTPTNQNSRHSPVEITAAHALLSLSWTPVSFAPNIFPAELMLAETLVGLSRSSVLLRDRSFSELVAAQALLDLTYSH